MTLAPPDHAAKPDPGGVRPLRWTRRRFRQAVEAGVFEDAHRVERVGGLVVESPRPAETFVFAVGAAADWCYGTFRPPAFHTGQCASLWVGRWHTLGPDVAVHAGPRRRSPPTLPPVLVIEVGEATVGHERRKAPIYARAGVGDFWLLNLPDRTLEVYRDPIRGPGRRWRYGSVTTHALTDAVSPLAAANATVKVADLLP